MAARRSPRTPPKAEDDGGLLKMNIVGDGGAGLTRPPRIEAMRKHETRPGSSFDTGEVSKLLTEKDSKLERAEGEADRLELTSPEELTDLPPLAETSQRIEPGDYPVDAPTLEQPKAEIPEDMFDEASDESEEEEAPESPFASIPEMPAAMSISPIGDDFLPGPEEL